MIAIDSNTPSFHYSIGDRFQVQIPPIELV